MLSQPGRPGDGAKPRGVSIGQNSREQVFFLKSPKTEFLSWFHVVIVIFVWWLK